MTSSYKAAGILKRQGEETDAVQNVRLNFAGDPVFAHLATLSTAASINGIEWEVDEGRKGTRLVAVRHRPGKRDTHWRGTPKERSASWTLDGGVKLGGRLGFDGRVFKDDSRVFPYSIDRSLTRRGDSTSLVNQLVSSEVSLIRPHSEVYGTPALKVGVLATHTAYSGAPKVEIINETVLPHEFDPILGLLKQVVEVDFPKDAVSAANTLLTRTRPTTTTQVTTLPPAHFEFHEALGVPAGYVDRARANFTTLAAYMNLPYELPSYTPDIAPQEQ